MTAAAYYQDRPAQGDEMSHVEITLKSGATITADVNEWTTQRSPLTNEVTGFGWDKPGPRRLVHVAIEEVAAVVFVEDDAHARHLTRQEQP